MEKVIKVGDKGVKFRATGQTMRLYRQHFQRDILKDMQKLQKQRDNGEEFSAEALMCFENIAWIMARQADPDNTPDTPDEWLDGFEVFSVYQILPEIFELWGINNISISIPKKKVKKPTAR